MRRQHISTPFLVTLLMFLLAAWMGPILLDPTGVPFWRSALFSDLLVSHLPNAIFTRRALQLWNQIPLWNPTILSGYPFLADPLAGIWYPPLWLAVAFPIPLMFNILLWLHLVWAGIGMWRLAQSEGLSDLGALISGLSFAAAPKWAAHIGLGHIGLVSAVAWTPWLLLGARSAITAQSMQRPDPFRAQIRSGLLVAVVFFADPRWLLPSLLLMLLYAFYVVQKLSFFRRLQAKALVRWAGVSGLFALGAVAGFASAFVYFVTNSTRKLLEAAGPDPFALQWSDLGKLILFKPDQPEQFIYLGLGALFFALIGLLFDKHKSWFWYLSGVLGLLISMGPHLPIIGPWLYSLPFASWLRVPPRWFYLTLLALAYFAGSGFDYLLQAPRRGREYLLGFLIVTLLIAGVLALTLISDPGTLDRTLLLMVPLFGFLPLLFIRRNGWLQPRTFTIAALLLLTIEYSMVNMLVLETRPESTALVSADEERLSAFETYGQGRIFSPSYNVDQLTAARKGIELADGVHPLQLMTYWVYMARATGFDPEQYSVTLPPFESGSPEDKWPIDLDLDALSRLNIEAIISAYPLQTDGLAMESTDGERYIYQLEKSRPRAWVEGIGQGFTDWGEAQVAYWSPNRIELVASGPGRLVLSEIAYPGWRVHVDGELTSMVVVDGLLRGVQLEPGNHRVTFIYRPTHFLIGTAVTLFTLLVALFFQVKR
ncbi:MAG: YfhO family protein [Anaerolineales bacterium]